MREVDGFVRADALLNQGKVNTAQLIINDEMIKQFDAQAQHLVVMTQGLQQLILNQELLVARCEMLEAKLERVESGR